MLLLVLLAACTRTPQQPSVPLAVQVVQTQTTPPFSHVILKVFRDIGGRSGELVRTSECVEVSSLQATGSGRRLLSVTIDPGGPYFLQFSGHNAAGCGFSSAVAAGFAPRVSVSDGRTRTTPIVVSAVDAWGVVEPRSVAGAEVVPRAFHSATVTTDGTLLVAGGAQEVVALGGAACAPGLTRCLQLSRATSGIHRFDAASGALVLVGALSERRFFHTATSLPQGRIVVAGGAQSGSVGGAGPASDSPLVRAQPECTNPNEASGAGCILSSLEIHRADGAAPQVASLTGGRALHAAAPLPASKLLLAGGRQALLQLGCASDVQCASGATCGADGRCRLSGQDCTQNGSICPAGFSCETTGPDSGKCLKRGCGTAADCGGCLASNGCTETESTCDTATGLCVKRGCGSDSECLGSNRRCVSGVCMQIGCDSLSGCAAGRVCDVRTGKCAPAGTSVDCASGGACNCTGPADCAEGFRCETAGELAGRCAAEQTGCPTTVCRRDVNDASQGPYFDPVTGALRREVNCEANQCVLRGCLGDVDCANGSLCVGGRCVNGRRITVASRATEVCDLSASSLPAQPCQGAADLAAPREGLGVACPSRDPQGACSQVLLWGGSADPAHVAELRDASGALTSEVALAGCAAAGSCTVAFSSVAETTDGVFAIGGAALSSAGGSRFNFLQIGYLVPSSAPTMPQPLAAQLAAPRAFAATVPYAGGVAVLGGADATLAATAAGGQFNAAGDVYLEPEGLRLKTPRFGHTATVLPDGRIVVIGGIDAANARVLSSVEIFVPRDILR